MVVCAVSDCDVSHRNNPDNCTFHRFPLHPTNRGKWLRLIGRVGWNPKKYSTICSKHFLENYFKKRRINTILLKGAMPTLFVPSFVVFCIEMEILKKFAVNGFFTAELYHLLSKKKMAHISEEIIPSEYRKEMSRSYTDRLNNLKDIQVANKISGSKEEDVLIFTPKILVFQNFKSYEAISTKFSILNNSKAPAFLNMIYEESSYFSIKPYNGKFLSRLAPGISITILVTFTPQSLVDYLHKVTFHTEKDEYLFLFVGMGPRPLLDFPDEIVIPNVPLKVEQTSSVIVHNNGMKPATFSLQSRCPFYCNPKCVPVKPGESVELKVSIKTFRIGEVYGVLNAVLETGENFHINLKGMTYTVKIEMEKQVVRFLDTYNRMVRQVAFKITNKSSNALNFFCMNNESVREDFEKKINLATVFYKMKVSEVPKCRKLEEYDVCKSDEHERVFTRILYDEIQILAADETLYFNNTHYSIEPLKGQLWPNQTTNITITFAPKLIGDFETTAYFDVDGLPERIPLKLFGTSLPPAIQLNVETLDLGQIFINKIYNYEIIAFNKGHIGGLVVYKEIATLFGSKITCNPHKLCIEPREEKMFCVAFSNSNQGPFFEEINFLISETDVILKLYLKGELIYPSLSFSIPQLDFGYISLGVPKTLEFDVFNKSDIDVKTTVKISTDGPEISSYTLEDYSVMDKPKPAIAEWPREFKIEPNKFTIASRECQRLKVTLCANIIRCHKTALELEFDKSDSPPIQLPVVYTANVPTITLAPNINLRACFVDYPYLYDLVIKSDGFEGYFTAEETDDNLPLKCTLKIKEGFIKPDSDVVIPAVIQCTAYGSIEKDVRLQLFGTPTPVVICHVKVLGVRPIITCTPLALHWSQVKLLTRSEKTLYITNDSPLRVRFKAYLPQTRDTRDNRWKIEPSEGELAPESETPLTVILYLNDAAPFQNKIHIDVEKVREILIPISATGTGSSILVGGSQDTIFIGRHFTATNIVYKVPVENRGAKLHILEWCDVAKPLKQKNNNSSFFKLEPKAFKLGAVEKFDLTISCIAHKAGTFKENWYLFGNIEGANKKELLLEININGEFVDPKVELHPSTIEFIYEHGPYNESYKLTGIVTIKNISGLPLDIDISMRSPFYMIQKQCYKISSEEENTCCCIQYNESDISLRNISENMDYQQSKQYIDYLTLKPVEPLRKSPINFFHDINMLKAIFTLCSSIEINLEDKEVMKLQVLLDTTKHTSLRSKTYVDIIKVKFKEHKNKDAIKLIGKINFPNVSIIPAKLDFNCVLNGSTTSKIIKIHNTTPLIVCYKFVWKKSSIVANEMPAFDITYEMESDDDILPIRDESKLETILGSSLKITDPEVTMEQVLNKVAPMLEMDMKEHFAWHYKLVTKPMRNLFPINDIIQCIPHRGILKPFELQNIHVKFQPTTDVNVKAILECNVLGGPTETCIVTGQSADLSYTLNTKTLKFGIRTYYENAIEELRITNTSLVPLHIKTYLNDQPPHNHLEAFIISIEPAAKILESQDTVVVKVLVKPGLVGFFRRTFLLEIGHLPCMPINVIGWGVIPQIHLSLNRSNIAQLPVSVGYEAIACLTDKYLQAVNEIMNRKKPKNFSDFEACSNDRSLSDWHICSVQDQYPEIMDIDLAIERKLAIDHIKKRPEIMEKIFTKSYVIPGFVTIPFLVDFGVIITGTSAKCVAEITNYGSGATKFYLSKGNYIPSWLGLKLWGKLKAGEVGKIEITFSPTAEDFPQLEEYVNKTFYCELPYGVTMPIQIKAICSVPFLVSNITNIDFGAVKCGNKMEVQIPIKNIGKTTCVWWVTLKLRTPGATPITVHDTSGKYEYNEGGMLRITFLPIVEMIYEGLLIFRFHMNPNKMTIPVRAQGLCPQLQIIGTYNSFAPTLPYSETKDIYFGITNPCVFPTELIISHCDNLWKQEEDIYKMLQKYYDQPEEMLVPVMRRGFQYPKEIIEFHQKVKDNVRLAMEQDNRGTTPKKSNTSSKKGTAIKSPKRLQSNRTLNIMPVRTEAEVLKDEISKLKAFNVDPLKACLENISDNVDSNVQSVKGIMIFVHASPCEENNFQEIAYGIGKKLSLPVVNVDLCIARALCVCEGQAKDTIMMMIDETFDNIKTTSKLGMNDSESGDIHNEVNEDEEDYEIVLRKIEAINNVKTVPSSKGKQAQVKPKNRSPTPSTLGSQSAYGPTGFISNDLIQELLSEYFCDESFSRGFVVDTLTSQILKNPPYVLTLILKCKRIIQNYHLVICHSEFHRWAHHYEELQKDQNQTLDAPKEYSEEEIKKIVENIEEMDDEEYENVSSEEKNIYINHGLEERRKRYSEKNRSRKRANPTEGNINLALRSGIATPLQQDSKKKLLKKEEQSVIGKKSLMKPGKQMSDFLLMNVKYNDYIKNTFEHLINIANNWKVDECEVGSPLLGFNGQVVGVAQKKAKKKLDAQESAMIYDEERGFPLTILTYSCLKYKYALANMFAQSSTVREALKEIEEVNILEIPINHKEYTVLLPKSLPNILSIQGLELKFLDEPVIQKCECNPMHFNLDDTNQDNIINVISNWHCVCGKKASSQFLSSNESAFNDVTSTDSSSIDYPLPVHQVKSLLEHGHRIMLQPGDLIRLKFAFCPTTEGPYNLERFVEVSGWPESRITIRASGICDLPRLDGRPKKMFDKFVRRRAIGECYQTTYIDELKTFEFGPIFIGNNRTYEEESNINIRNSSLLRSKVDIEFLFDVNIFQFDLDLIVLEPEEKSILKISAAPTVVGVFKNELLFCIKDNPEMIKIELSCQGVVPIVVILPLLKHIDYGKMLLYRRVEERIIIKNDSVLPIMWKFRNPEMFNDTFMISRTTGIIPAFDNEVIPITYIACQVGVISRRELIIDIYDSKGRGEAMITDMMYFSAECYDVLVECTYNDEKYLNYGNVKVNSTVVEDLYLFNRGKYNIYYKLKKVKKFPYPTLLSTMEVSRESGVLLPGRMIAIEFQCSPNASIDLHNVPAFTCYLLDGNIDQVIVAKFPICITIASFYNTFTLFPLGELNFHIIPLSFGVTREVIITNTSKCPFTYEIVVPEKYMQNSALQIERSRGKDNKIKIPPLNCGNFIIYNEDNLLEPGTSRTIQINFVATEARLFEEIIKFIVSDTSPAEADGVPLKLSGTGAIPVLDIWNLETTFREHMIVNTFSDYKVCEASPHCVLAEDTISFHFICVTINTSHVAPITLYNNGLVECEINMVMHYQANTNKDIFYLKKYNAIIEPLLSKNLDIVFAPKALKKYRAVLEIKLKLLQNEEESYKICLVGEGVIPRIKFTKPKLKPSKVGIVELPVTCLGSCTQKSISFLNISNTKCMVHLRITQQHDEQQMFSLSAAENCDHMIMTRDKLSVTVVTNPTEVCTMNIYYDPYRRGRVQSNILITIENNPFESFTILCEGEAFMEDIILLGLELLPLETDETGYSTSASSKGSKKRKSADGRTSRRKSIMSFKMSSGDVNYTEPSILKYLLDFGGNEIRSLQRRTVIMANNSDKVYKFTWDQNFECIIVKPNVGYISPGEEKDLEIVFYSDEQVRLIKEALECTLVAVDSNMYEMNNKDRVWANNQTITVFNQKSFVTERGEHMVEDHCPAEPTPLPVNMLYILITATTEHVKYTCNLQPTMKLPDTFIYQKHSFEYNFVNEGIVPLKVTWVFQFDEEFPVTINKMRLHTNSIEESTTENTLFNAPETEPSYSTLFSGDSERQSVDTWFEFHMPFSISPEKKCLKPKEKQVFTVTFAPLDAFFYKVRMRSVIDNLNPKDRIATTKITAKSLIPFCHLELEESDYVSSGRRKPTNIPLPENLTVLEFSVVGSGCYQKTFKVINPTSESYDFVLDMVMSSKAELIPIHCDPLKGFLKEGSSADITCTFAPAAPGITESIWHLLIPKHSLTINIMVVGIVREPKVSFVPEILNMKNSIVGHEIIEEVKLKNYENETLKFEFKGNSLCNEEGKTPVIVTPNEGVLMPRAEKRIRLNYTPFRNGPLSFKIFCWVQYMAKGLTLCVNALSHLIKPHVTYSIVGHEHILDENVDTHIHLEKTAATYERTVPFVIKNDGSATFRYDWSYNSTSVKKYMLVSIKPRNGYVAPGEKVSCVLYLTIKQVLVKEYPISLMISNGPKYLIYINAVIEKPLYHFSLMEYNFEKCLYNAPDGTYRKKIIFVNNDVERLILDLDFENIPELFVHYHKDIPVEPNDRKEIVIMFRPKEAKVYEFKLRFWVNSLCEEIVTIRGEGVPLLLDLYEGCQKSFDLGVVKVGQKVIKEIEVMNHSQVSIDSKFIFREMYGVSEEAVAVSESGSSCLEPDDKSIKSYKNKDTKGILLQEYRDDKLKEQVALDVKNALASLKVTPDHAIIEPHRKLPLKIQFKPIGIISTLDVQLNIKVLHFERPLVRLKGSASGMYLYLSQNSLQFGRVRRHGCKTLKVMLWNKGDFDARFCWQPLNRQEFSILPMQGTVEAHSNVSFTFSFHPVQEKPFIKGWACCNIENYNALEISMHGTCHDAEDLRSLSIYFETPVRQSQTVYFPISNPSGDLWVFESKVTAEVFETLKKITIESLSTFEIPITYRPKAMGKDEAQIIYSPIRDAALILNVFGVSLHPLPNDSINIIVAAKETKSIDLKVFNLTDCRETYSAVMEIIKTIPDKFERYEFSYPKTIKVWGEAAATFKLTFVCYEECEMHFKVTFINDLTREYQFYTIVIKTTPNPIAGVIKITSNARETVIHNLPLRNPLSTVEVFQIHSESLKHEPSHSMPARAMAKIPLEYSPLVVGTSEELLVVSHPFTGTICYKLILTCLPAKEKELEYKIPLGQIMPIRLRVENRSDSKAEFICTTTHPCILYEKSLPLNPHETGKFLVWFEPTELGTQKCVVTCSSVVAGDFVFNITGIGSHPQPQGPIEIKVGGSNYVKFKNVFTEVKTFSFFTDKDVFFIKSAWENVKPKKECTIMISLLDYPYQSELPTGVMTVELQDQSFPKIVWTYFLQGIP